MILRALRRGSETAAIAIDFAIILKSEVVCDGCDVWTQVKVGLVARYVAHVNFLDDWALEVGLYMETVTSIRYQVVREVSSCHLST